MAEKPPTPDLPKYLREPLEKQSPERLETVATYASELAEWKRKQREAERAQRQAEEEVDEEELEDLEERDIPTEPEEYDDVPTGAYITVKTTKQTGEKAYRYYYWQWREGDSWKNEYIAPVNPE